MSHYAEAVRYRYALSAALILSVVVGSAAGAARTRLVISGAFPTSSARAMVGTGEGCGYRSTRTLIYQSAAMRIGRGPAVARVSFRIVHYRGRRRYGAKAPAPYGRTAVQVVTGRNATTGVASGFYIATSGSVNVLQAKNVGRTGHAATVSGTVHAKLRLQRGTKRLRLDGSWACRIPPEANGD